MCNLITSIQRPAFLALFCFSVSCQQHPKTLSPAVTAPSQAPVTVSPKEEPEFNILPFPEHFSLARQDLSEFDCTVNVKDFFEGKKTPIQGLSVLPVLSSRFGCYTLRARELWSGEDSENCLYNQRFSGPDTFVYKGFVLAILYDESAYKRPVITAWKIRGDSLDFYTILNRCFEPDNEGCEMQIDSILPLSSKKQRIFGQISWDSILSHRVVRAWSAIWTLPDNLDFH